MKKPELVILWTIVVLALLTIAVDTFFAKHANLNKANTYNFVFSRLERYQIKNKISYSYHLYVQGQSVPHVIAADYVNCFDNEAFEKEINGGDTITIKTEKLGLIRGAFIISILKNNVNYVDLKCINDEISSSKKSVIFLAILFLSILFFWYNIRKTKLHPLTTKPPARPHLFMFLIVR